MNAIIDAAIGRSRTVLMVLSLILIAGTIAYISIPKESDPDVNIPIIYVGMSHDGISPEDAERLLVRPMEQELRSIEGIKEMRSNATEGYASVLLEFDAGFDADLALADVREKVDVAKVELPDETDEPTVNEVNVSLFPVIVIMLSGDMPERTLLRHARDLQDKLEGLPGVLSANIVGNREELLEVIVDPVRLESYRVSQEDLIRAIDFNNRLVAAGALDTGAGRFSVKVPGLFETAKGRSRNSGQNKRRCRRHAARHHRCTAHVLGCDQLCPAGWPSHRRVGNSKTHRLQRHRYHRRCPRLDCRRTEALADRA